MERGESQAIQTGRKELQTQKSWEIHPPELHGDVRTSTTISWSWIADSVKRMAPEWLKPTITKVCAWLANGRHVGDLW